MEGGSKRAPDDAQHRKETQRWRTWGAERKKKKKKKLAAGQDRVVSTCDSFITSMGGGKSLVLFFASLTIGLENVEQCHRYADWNFTRDASKKKKIEIKISNSVLGGLNTHTGNSTKVIDLPSVGNRRRDRPFFLISRSLLMLSNHNTTSRRCCCWWSTGQQKMGTASALWIILFFVFSSVPNKQSWALFFPPLAIKKKSQLTCCFNFHGEQPATSTQKNKMMSSRISQQVEIITADAASLDNLTRFPVYLLGVGGYLIF